MAVRNLPLRSRLALLTALLTGLGVSLGVGAAPSSQAAPTSSAKPPDYAWHPYRTEDIHYPAGERCSFAVTGTVVKDREQYRNVNFWPNGKPRTQEFRGPLTIRWKHVGTRRSVLRDQAGHAYASYDRAGDLVSLTALSGHFGAGLPKGSTPFTGIGYLGGRWTSITINDNGTVTVSLGPHGTIENLCRTLAT